VTVRTTSTVWVDDQGVPLPLSDGVIRIGPDRTALGVGLGLGIPAGLAAIGIGIWIWLRRRGKQAVNSPMSYLEPLDKSGAELAAGTPRFRPADSGSAIFRKAVATSLRQTLSPTAQTTELSGQGVRREVEGRELNTMPAVHSGSIVNVPGKHELWAQGNQPPVFAYGTGTELDSRGVRHELPSQTWTPPPDYQSQRTLAQDGRHQSGAQ
jgi:hypothetical protein